ncbi:MAG TPA: hypothetical protein VF042_14200 [Gemmatimonadaceae bacterium]
MTITSSNRDQLLQRLLRFAGDPQILDEALNELSAGATPPTLEQILHRILKIRQERGLGMPRVKEPAAAVTP